MGRLLALQAQSQRIRSLEGGLALTNPSLYWVETEALEAPNWPQVQLVLRRPLLEAHRIINGIWSNYRDSKAPHLFLGRSMRFLRRVEWEGGGEVARRWQIVGESSLTRPVPWPARVYFYIIRLKSRCNRAYLSKVLHLVFL